MDGGIFSPSAITKFFFPAYLFSGNRRTFSSRESEDVSGRGKRCTSVLLLTAIA